MSPRLPTAVMTLLFCLGSAAQDQLPVDPQSGLVMDRNWELILANCSGCHSTRLVIQNHMSAGGWTQIIRWMQEKHNLWDLGTQEPEIVAYLVRNYGVAPDPGALPMRRQPLNQPPLSEQE